MWNNSNWIEKIVTLILVFLIVWAIILVIR